MKPRFVGVGIMIVGLALVLLATASSEYSIADVGAIVIVLGAVLAWFLETKTKEKKGV